jgi:hypothetical protein
MPKINALFHLVILFTAVASIELAQGADGAFTSFEKPLKIGAAGWLVGLDINRDGTRLVRTDTYGAYIWDASSQTWSQLVTQSRMPPANFGYYPRFGTSQINQNGLGGNGGGVYEICSAPSNSSIIYMMTNGWIFKSVDKGATFSKTSFGRGLPLPMSSNGPYRMNGRKMAVDPVNPLIVYAGSDTLGLFVTVDGGKNWIRVTALPTAAGTTNYNIAFDPASAAINGATSVVYIFASNAVYVSTDAGATWSATKDGPKTVQHLVVAKTGGAVWAVDGLSTGGLWKYSSGTWANILPSRTGLHSVAVDPSNSMHIVAGGTGGAIYVSSDAHTFSAAQRPARVAADVPWLASTNENYMSNGDMIFDPSTSNTLVFAEGVGVWTTTLPAFGPVMWTSISAGIEQLVARDIIAPNGIPIVGASDRATFALPYPDIYPGHANTTFHNSFALNVTWALDYASSNPSFVAGVIGDIGSATNNNSGASTDGGMTWRPFNSYYEEVEASAISNDGSGLVRISLSSTAGLTTWSAGEGSIVRVVNFNGASAALRRYWPVTVVDATHIDLRGSQYSKSFSETGNYYVYVDTNPLSDNNGGYKILGTASDGGLINVGVVNTSQAMVDNTIVCISGVQGTTEANGCWVSTHARNTANEFGGKGSFSLYGSMFKNQWAGGGSASKIIPPGGSIAVSTPLNMILLGSNHDYPQCTSDGGQTWTQIRYPADLPPGAATGWNFASYINRHTISADRVTANTFFLYNSVVGTYEVVNCKVVALNRATIPNATFNSTMKSVPGHARHLIFAIGSQGNQGSPHPSGGALRWSNNGGATWISIADTAEPRAIGVGAIAPGSDYPTVYMVGWYRYQYGIWRSTSNGEQWASNTVKWTKVADYPLGSMDGVTAFAADQLTWNKWYLGWGGSGFGYGQQN